MRGKSGTLARAPAQLPEETGSWSELWALHPATPRGPAPARLCAGFWGWAVSPTCLHREFFSALSPAVTLGLEVHRAWVNTPSSRLVFCPPCSPALVNNQRQKELHDSVKLKHFLVSKCRAAKVGNAARAGTLRRGTAWLARHRGFPSLQPRRVPVCGTRRAPACGAPPAAEATLVARGGKGSLPPVPAAPSKKQGAVSCPLGRPAKGNPVGNWISQPRVSRALGAALFLLNGSCVGLREISAPIHSRLQDVMDSVLIQALACGCGFCVFVPGVCTFTVSEYEASQ